MFFFISATYILAPPSAFCLYFLSLLQLFPVSASTISCLPLLLALLLHLHPTRTFLKLFRIALQCSNQLTNVENPAPCKHETIFFIFPSYNSEVYFPRKVTICQLRQFLSKPLHVHLSKTSHCPIPTILTLPLSLLTLSTYSIISNFTWQHSPMSIGSNATSILHGHMSHDVICCPTCQLLNGTS